MSLLTTVINLGTDRYVMRLASTREDVLAAQELRFRVFNLELNEGLAASYALERDEDQFDEVCDHLLVTSRETGEVVGTYRMQTGRQAQLNHGYYSASEFDFSPFEPVRDQIIELGRACVARDHRNQTVLGLLWKGIARYARENAARYLVGCSSLTSQDGPAGLATYRVLRDKCLVASPWRTLPLPGWRCPDTQDGHIVEPIKIPKLMGLYLAIGARICGEPALDREFGTIVFLTWLDLEALPSRVLKKYLS